ncbi:MAG: hypothetical protein JKY56_15935 [Kofleriaceae bacterium]|nr:hypothetical protein [Kofleriaceae bacterium]
MNSNETKIYGQHACHALFAARPNDIVRVLFTEKGAVGFGELMKHCASEHKPYRIVPNEELEKVSGARHHEGVCIVAWPRATRNLDHILADQGPGLILALDKVSNPHNIGTLLRTSAHFGVRAVLLGGALRRLSAAAYRTAEGAAETVDVFFGEDLKETLTDCKAAGFSICATSSHQGDSLYETALPKRCVVLLGAERDGLSKPLFAMADTLLCIPGSSQVESLNVASSAAVFLGEYWRQYGSALS